MSTFKINEVVLHLPNKEFVQITNGTDAGGVFAPTEAMALRVIGFEAGKPIIAYTYIAVRPEQLGPCHSKPTLFDDYAADLSGKKFKQGGRI